MDTRPPRLTAALAVLLALSLPSCVPKPAETEDEKAEATHQSARKVAATPTPEPKPGAWMYEKRTNPLGIPDDSLNQKPK